MSKLTRVLLLAADKAIERGRPSPGGFSSPESQVLAICIPSMHTQ
jgi:hypothetical protein